MEFIVPTYGSYSDLVYAVGVVSRIIHSDTFNSLMAIMLFIAALIGLTAAVSSAFFKGGKVSHSFGINIVLGFIFIFTFIKPTATVVIEDKYYGKSGTAGYFTALQDVPFGAAVMIWFYGYTQEIVVKMIDDFGSPVVSIGDGGTDISYKLLTNADGMIGAARTATPQFVENVENYIRDCVLVGVSTDQISMENLTKPGTENLWDEMRLEAGGIFTEYNRMPQSCPAAHASITAAFDATEKTKIEQAYCADNNIAIVNYKVDPKACSDKIGALTTGFFNKAAGDFMMTYIAAASTQNVAESYIELADKQTYVANATAAVQAEKWLPKLRSNTFVVVVLLAPLVFLLIFYAPGAVIKWYGGMYVWLILWGGVDQLMFVMYQKELYDVFSVMRDSGLGFLQVLDVKAEMLETLGLYGKMRWVSMSLSLAMCMGILKIGNNAMVGIAESMGASAQQTAGQAASALSGVGGTAAAQDQYTRQQARGALAGVTSWEAVADQEMSQYQQGIKSAAAMSNAFSGFTGAANMQAQNAVQSALQQQANRELAESKAAYSGVAVSDILSFEAKGGVVNADNMAMVSQLYGVDQSQLREGMAMRGTWTGSGFDNVVATEANFTSSKGMSGDLRTSFGDDGQMSRAEFSGVANGQKTNITWDGDGQVYKSSQSGFESSYVNFTSSKTGHQNENLNIDRNITDKTTTATYGDRVTYMSGVSDDIGNRTLWDSGQGQGVSIASLGLFNGDGSGSNKVHMIASTLQSEFTSTDTSNLSMEARMSLGVKLGEFFGFDASMSTGESSAISVNMLEKGIQDKFTEINNNPNMTVAQKDAALAQVVMDVRQIRDDTFGYSPATEKPVAVPDGAGDGGLNDPKPEGTGKMPDHYKSLND